ncbi:LOW QUALITY PROTEIN: U4/U6 small nuclear ribonucleoprotein Prp31 [Cyanocitta cristata]
MSLVDELVADLEEAAEEEDKAEGSEGGEEPPVEDMRKEPEPSKAMESVWSIAKLWESKAFTEITQKIEEYIGKQPKVAKVLGPVEAAPEYWVIMEANNLPVEFENELNIIHKFIWDKYSKQFLELESLVPNALDYIQTIKELGNSLDKCKNNKNTQQILTNATTMVVSVTASTTRGQQLLAEEPGRTEDACDPALALSRANLCIYEYMASRMSFIAPNLSLILGASTAAKIMGMAGGLTLLSKLPPCNILLLGAQHQVLPSFSSTSVLPHTGFIYHSNIVQSLLPDLRRKAARLVAAKCMLVARVDSFHESQDGKVGYKLREKIDHKFDKWQEPSPVKQVKPLPTLLEEQRKMGGWRYREMKECLGLTEIANRVSFREIEEDTYQENLRFSLGHLGKAGSDDVCQTQVNEATKAWISKTLQRTLQKQSVIYGGKSTIQDHGLGMALSVAFTLQGLEIVNPQAAKKRVAKANQKYFYSMAKFLKVNRDRSGVPTSPEAPGPPKIPPYHPPPSFSMRIWFLEEVLQMLTEGMAAACSKHQRTELEETSEDNLVQCPYLTQAIYNRLSQVHMGFE